MYTHLISKIKELGDALVLVAGKVADISQKKIWLTEWDIKIETELTNLIHMFPGEHVVYAEEISNTYVGSENVWIIDPISNTLNFIHGLPHYSVVVSHMHKGQIIFAVVYDPSTQEMFTAEKGKGAFLNNNKISVSNRKEDLVVLMGPSLMPTYNRRQKTLKLLDICSQIGAVRTFGSLGVHYAYVACGRADIAVSLNKDVYPEFAGKLLVEEAGGKFTDFEAQDLSVATRSILATNGLTHAQVLRSFAD